MGRFQYTGQAYLPETGLYHYKARAYSPTLARFLQADPIGYAGGMNLYAYVGGDPVNGRDPSGLKDPNEGQDGLVGDTCTGSFIQSGCDQFGFAVSMSAPGGGGGSPSSRFYTPGQGGGVTCNPICVVRAGIILRAPDPDIAGRPLAQSITLSDLSGTDAAITIAIPSRNARTRFRTSDEAAMAFANELQYHRYCGLLECGAGINKFRGGWGYDMVYVGTRGSVKVPDAPKTVHTHFEANFLSVADMDALELAGNQVRTEYLVTPLGGLRAFNLDGLGEVFSAERDIWVYEVAPDGTFRR